MRGVLFPDGEGPALSGLAAMGEMTLVGVMGVLALFLGPHWQVSSEEARAWGKALEAWLKSLPASRRRALMRALNVAPTVNLVGTTALILLPRIQTTIQMMEAKRGQGRARESAFGASTETGTANPRQPDGYDFAGAIAKLSKNYAREPGPGRSPDDSELRQEVGEHPKA